MCEHGLDTHLVSSGKEEEEGAGEVMRVAVGVPQLVRQRVEEQVAPLNPTVPTPLRNIAYVTFGDVILFT